jgi:hypothetical protein
MAQYQAPRAAATETVTAREPAEPSPAVTVSTVGMARVT